VLRQAAHEFSAQSCCCVNCQLISTAGVGHDAHLYTCWLAESHEDPACDCFAGRTQSWLGREAAEPIETATESSRSQRRTAALSLVSSEADTGAKQEESNVGAGIAPKQPSPPEAPLPSIPAFHPDNALRSCSPWPPIHGRRIRWHVNECSCSRSRFQHSDWAIPAVQVP
jgi:hypothetical protein